MLPWSAACWRPATRTIWAGRSPGGTCRVGIMHTILGSFGGALAVASRVGGATGALLARAARAAFMSGLEVSFLVGAVVSLAGVVAVLIWLPSRALPVPPDPPGERVIVPDYPVPNRRRP